MVTGENQATRLRGLYLKTILRQDIAFFDTETTTGEVISRMSGDTILIQNAMGEKVRLQSFHYIFANYRDFIICHFIDYLSVLQYYLNYSQMNRENF